MKLKPRVVAKGEDEDEATDVVDKAEEEPTERLAMNASSVKRLDILPETAPKAD